MLFRQSGQVLRPLFWNHLNRQMRWNECLHVPHSLSGNILSDDTIE